ncbi:MAG TPA: protease inhibitor I42 family protein [Methanoregula sp.]|nr:protease inhibitor I42 family protein [Methanoregula sp.]
MNTTTIIAGICIVCFAAVAVAGCLGTGPETPSSPASPQQTAVPSASLSGTPAQAGHLVINESQNNATVPVNRMDIITVQLAENPTTGYRWNLTATPGLNVTSDTYVPSDTTGTLVGSGGTRIWDITPTAPGEQHVSAVYQRSWEPLTGNETAFAITVIVR